MSDKDRKKKDGQNTNKKAQRMRAGEEARHNAAGPAKPQTDEKDVLKFKRGSQNDRTTAGRMGSTG